MLASCGRTRCALAAHTALQQQQSGRAAPRRLPPPPAAPAWRQTRGGQRCLAAAAGKGDKSWGEIAAEAAGVVKDVAKKVKDTATSAIQGIRQQAPGGGLRRQQEQRRRDYGRGEDRPLPVPLPGGGLLGGLVGSLVGAAAKGVVEQLQRSAEESRSVADRAARRISGSAAVKRRLGEVSVGLPVSQSVSSQSINGRVSKTVSLLLPVFNAAGAPVAQAQVTQAEGAGAQQACKVVVRMPEGDSIVLDGEDDGGGGGGWGRGASAGSSGEVVDAEFYDLPK